MNTTVKYTSAAFPPSNIKLNCEYTFGKDKKGYFLAQGNDKFYYDLKYIKMFFSPTKGTWNSVLKKK